MKRLFAALVLAVGPFIAHAQVPHLEAGYGLQWSKDMGDGTWYQQGGPHTRNLNGKAYLLGLTGDLYERGSWSIRYHADYMYYGGLRAGCTCTEWDADYDPVRHVRTTANPTQATFNGFGHVQGIPVTLDIGYTWHGLRFAVEGGMWAYWQTWHDTAMTDSQGDLNLSHKTAVQFAPVVGARVDNGNFSLSYRYYQVRALWNPNPGIVTGTHMLMTTYRF